MADEVERDRRLLGKQAEQSEIALADGPPETGIEHLEHADGRAGPSLEDRLAARGDGHLALGEEVEPVASLALLEHPLSGRDGEELERAGEVLERRRRQRGEERHAAQERESSFGRRGRVELAQRAPRERNEHGQEGAGRDERAVQPQARDEGGSDERARDRRSVHDALEDPEDAREHVLGHGALEQRERGHVDERVREADERDQDEGACCGLPGGEQGDWHPPEHDFAREGPCEPSTDEAQRHRAADDAADAQRREEDAELLLAAAEHVEGNACDEHEERPRRAPARPSGRRAARRDDRPPAFAPRPSARRGSRLRSASFRRPLSRRSNERLSEAEPTTRTPPW